MPIAQAFPTGHRLRLSLSTLYWPLAWPSPAPACLTVYPRAGAIDLPVRAPPRRPDTARLWPDRGNRVDAAADDRLRSPQLAGPPRPCRGSPTLEVIDDNGVCRLEEVTLEVANRTTEWYSSEGDDFRSRGETRAVRRLQRGTGRCAPIRAPS
ncbi:hypothetical protein DLJ49_05395 [Rhodovulum sp. 12E13]|nr:hypothetical protein DLJ49_05395 [Rhodovulum sp. 12E13]